MVARNFIVFLTLIGNSSIAFVRVFENRLAPNYCDAGTAQLRSIASDIMHQTIIYGLSTENELFIFDEKQHGNKADTIECKSKGFLTDLP